MTVPGTDAAAEGERTAGYAESSIRSWRALLHLILADAVETAWSSRTRRRSGAAVVGV
jgi:hypothetical protein